MSPDPLEDDSRWVMLNSRFDTDTPMHRWFDEMFEDWVQSLPADSPARLLHDALPKPPHHN